MSGPNRRRNSKWDSKEDHALPGKTDIFVRSGPNRDDNFNDDCKRSFKPMSTGDADDGYGARMSPGLEDWRHQSDHYSSKNEWKRSNRSRSVSRSSRSRSPVHGYRREAGICDRNRSRSTLSAQLCKDFAVGRCRRGNRCPFLHEDSQNYEDDWERHGRAVSSRYATPNGSRDYSMKFGKSSDVCTEFIKGNCRKGASCRFIHQGTSSGLGKEPGNEMIGEKEDEQRHHRYSSPERHTDRESRRVIDAPCKFFASGNCRNGKLCRFSHNEERGLSPVQRPRDGRYPLVQNSDDVEKSRTISKWSDVNISVTEDKINRADASKSMGSAWSADDRWNPTMDGNKPLINLLNSQNAVEGDKKRTSQWKTENFRDLSSNSEHRDNDNWLGDMDSYPEWDFSVQRSDPTGKESNSLPTHGSVMTQEASGRMHDIPLLVSSRVNETSSIQKDFNAREVGSSTLGNDNAFSGNPQLNSSTNFLGMEGFNQNSQNSNALPVSFTSMVGQNQATVSADPSRGRNILPQNQMQVQNGNSTSNQGTVEAVVVQERSDIPVTQNMVNAEQITQLTNLSASLAQLLANGQKISQLHAAHSTQNVTDIPSLTNLGEAVKTDSAMTSPLSQDLAHQKMLDHLSDKTEPSTRDGAHNLVGFDENLSKKNGSADGKLGTNNDNKSYLTSQPELAANSEATEEENGLTGDGSKKVKEEIKTAQLENIDGDDKGDESKKGKDLKGNRVFKFALVEFVKDVLKPKWKEGQMTKEAYKNIVKKVVDKVIGTMQGNHIPQSQEKIEQYLSSSKPKLTKLVQAYVEKIRKDK